MAGGWSSAAAAQLAVARGLGHVDGGDDRELEELPPQEPAALPSLIWLRYRNARGEISERSVTLRFAWSEDGVTYCRGLCHMRGALRTFRADQIEQLVCLATGECPDSPGEWLAHHGLFGEHTQDSATVSALRACRDELMVLAYMGHSDGHLDPEEVEVAIDFVMMSTEADIDRAHCESFIKRLAPDPDDLEAVVNRLAKRPDRWDDLRRSVRRLVDADGIVTASEQLAWDEIQRLFDAAQGRRR